MTQGFVEDYSQRLIEGNIVRVKLSRLRLYMLGHNRLRLPRLWFHRQRLSKLPDSGGEGGGGSTKLYIPLLVVKNNRIIELHSFY